jgi:hypothetical protein
VIHHHVQDGGGCDLTADILNAAHSHAAGQPSGRYRFTYSIGNDGGMYDALNRAYAATGAPLIGHLNCDEQYLPGTLERVIDWFQQHPEHDLLFGGAVIIDPEGGYLSSRLPVRPGPLYIQLCHLPVLTASMFYRRRLIERTGRYFDPAFRSVGDADLVLRMLEHCKKSGVLREHLSLFVHSGDNLNQQPVSREERVKLGLRVPRHLRWLRPWIRLWFHVRKALSGAYRPRPFSYTYLSAEGAPRVYHIERPTGRWRER